MSDQKKNKTIHSKEYHLMIFLLREMRENKGVTQKDLADIINVDQTFISKIEGGERRLDFLELRTICIALEVSVLDFVKEMENRIINKRR